MTIEKSEDTKICVLCLYGYIFASITAISFLYFLLIEKTNLADNSLLFPTTFLIVSPSIHLLVGLLPPAILIGCIGGTLLGHYIGIRYGKHDIFVIISSAFWGFLLSISVLLFDLVLPAL
jgi:hypothetical protein